jgi:hypothetical protein
MYKNGVWIPEDEFAQRIHSARHIDRPVFQDFHAFITSFTGITEEPLEDMEGWDWIGI